MIDKTIFDNYAAALETNAGVTKAYIQALWNKVKDLSDDQAMTYLNVAYAEIIDKMGAVAATAAQEFYTEQRLLANVESEYTAQTFTPNTAIFLQEDIKKAFEKVSGRVGIDNLSGYDPAGLASRYRNCEDTIRNVAESEWENMSPEERKKYESKGKSAWDNYLTCRTQAEMRRRDDAWLRTGECSGPDYSDLNDKQFKDLKDYERKAYDCLAYEHGIIPKVLPVDDDKPANIDVLIEGKLWELKNPKDGKHAVEDRITEGVSKWTRLQLDEKPRLIISNSEGTRSDKDVLDEAARRCEWYGVGELLFMSHDGKSLVRREF